VRDPAGLGESEVDGIGAGRVVPDGHDPRQFERIEHRAKCALVVGGIEGARCGPLRPAIAEEIESQDAAGSEKRDQPIVDARVVWEAVHQQKRWAFARLVGDVDTAIGAGHHPVRHRRRLRDGMCHDEVLLTSAPRGGQEASGWRLTAVMSRDANSGRASPQWPIRVTTVMPILLGRIDGRAHGGLRSCGVGSGRGLATTTSLELADDQCAAPGTCWWCGTPVDDRRAERPDRLSVR